MFFLMVALSLPRRFMDTIETPQRNFNKVVTCYICEKAAVTRCHGVVEEHTCINLGGHISFNRTPHTYGCGMPVCKEHFEILVVESSGGIPGYATGGAMGYANEGRGTFCKTCASYLLSKGWKKL